MFTKEQIQEYTKDAIVFTIDEYIDHVKYGRISNPQSIAFFGHETEGDIEADYDIEYLNRMKNFYEYVYWHEH